MIYTVTFNPAIDYVIQLDHLEMGSVNRTKNEQMYYGGKGINVSTILKNLGIESVALGFVSGFTGVTMQKGLKDAGIQTDFISLSKGMTRINVKIKADVETELNGQGPEVSEEALLSLLEKILTLQDNDILVLAGSIPSTVPDNIYENIMALLQDRNIKVVVDATKELLLNVLKYRPFLIKPNHHELGELFQVALHTTEDIIYYAKQLQERGARNVLISMAGDGAILIDETQKCHRIGAPKGIVKNSVGAGDSMVAGFLAGYLKWNDYGQALKLGSAAGSATAFSDGLASEELINQLFDYY